MSTMLQELFANGTTATPCNSTDRAALLIFSSTAALSFLVCSAALVLVYVMKLHRRLIYRLAAYQVISALVYSVIELSQLAFLSYEGTGSAACIAVAFLNQYVLGIKLMLTVWVTYHLFCFAVLYKNMKRLEAAYVLTSLAIPLVLAFVPFTTRTYGLAGSWCWIRSSADDCTPSVQGVTEQFALFYGPAVVALVVESVAMMAILIILISRKKNTLLALSHKHDEALNRMLPLASYPFVFCVLIVPPLVYRAYSAAGVSRNRNFLLAAAFFHPFWSFSAGMALLVHAAIVLRMRKQQWKVKHKSNELKTLY